MSADLPSSNPFRRKGTTPTVSVSVTAPAPAPALSIQSPPLPVEAALPSQNEKPLRPAEHVERPDAPRIQTKTVKKVRVQSPPPSSPEADATSYPPTPISRNDSTAKPGHDPFDGSLSDASEDEQPLPQISSMPANPFQKTLETMEGGSAPASAAAAHVVSPGRASMDVEAFKRLLMTGNSGVGNSTTTGPPTLQVIHHGLGDGGSSTDTSSISRQSIFEPVHETHSESPRTSHEISEPDDEQHRGSAPDHSVAAPPSRRKPPPPSSRHGKLIKMELRDDPTSPGLQISPPSTGISQQQFNASTSSLLSSERSPTDLNKPLPPAPPSASHESDRESIFDREAAGKTPEPPSPSASIKRKTPPAPPIARRHSQLVSDSKLSRHNSGRLSPRVEEDSASISDVTASRPRSDSGRAPPPPPSRRSGSPVPPARMSSGRRPPSVSSMEMANNRRASVVPPPPPPRHAQNSHDAPILSPASRRTSGEESRRSMDSTRRASVESTSASYLDRPGTSSSGKDILADLSALQREIDALRGQSQKQAT